MSLIPMQVKLRPQYTIQESRSHAVHTAAGNKAPDFFGRRLPLASLRAEPARFRSIALGARCPFPPYSGVGAANYRFARPRSLRFVSPFYPVETIRREPFAPDASLGGVQERKALDDLLP